VDANNDFSIDQYRDLAEFRRQIRLFLHFSESTAREHGIEPQQHQLLLTVHGLPEGVKPTVGEIAARLYLQHHSVVELVNRMEKAGTVVRNPGPEDKREVWIQLTAAGRDILRSLSLAHRTELECSGPELARALKRTLRHATTVSSGGAL
jgi:DNA-binding MarR family transcriptional regulator